MLEGCAASLAGLAVGAAGLWKTFLGFWLLSFAKDADALCVSPPTACALITGVGFFCARKLLTAIVHLPPTLRTYATGVLICMFMVPNSVFIKTIIDSLWREPGLPLYYRALMIAMNIQSVGTNVVLLNIISAQRLGQSYEAASWSASLLLLFDLWALALWGWPFVEGI